MKPVSESFKKRADPAAFWEAWVGTVLSRSGLYTVHMPFEIDGKDHSLSHDLTVYKEHPQKFGDEFEVEVKSRNLTFTCPEDYPFEHVNVCSWNNFRKKWPGKDKTGRDFVFVSTATGAILWLPKGTPIHISDAWDGERNESFKVVDASSEALRPLQDFVEMVKGG